MFYSNALKEHPGAYLNSAFQGPSPQKMVSIVFHFNDIKNLLKNQHSP